MGPIRIKSWFKSKHSKLGSDLETQVSKAQNGDECIRHDLLEQYRPFIKKVASKACKRYISESMDEYSIGLLAFNEAIDQYDKEQGNKFLTFASVVIHRRIIDHIRKESRHNYVLLNEEEDEEGNVQENVIERRTSIEKYEIELESKARAEEIFEYQKLLLTYDITFEVLTSQCPKHIDARENAKKIAKVVYENHHIRSYLEEKRRLPVSELEDIVACSRKTIERNRKYIIAMALIYIGNFTTLKSYIEPEGGLK
ncbi:RNA polymerase sigma-I factor [Calidifontibacillus oryziterrae]|uniref:RNA polymerase sigma-I factor n=1 Tax=Calidifontibacillus oryziterrae TaxID=1191699 RepID=UPI0002EBD1DB|nr:RNA polymerase sigma-I factor [Calidifontibacillus oryziterrae]